MRLCAWEYSCISISLCSTVDTASIQIREDIDGDLILREFILKLKLRSSVFYYWKCVVSSWTLIMSEIIHNVGILRWLAREAEAGLIL